MFDIKKIRVEKIKDKLNKWLRVLAGNTFLTFLALFIISLIIGALIFVRCSILIEMPAENIGEDKIFKFESKTYQKILQEWQLKNERFSKINKKKYPNPFLH